MSNDRLKKILLSSVIACVLPAVCLGNKLRNGDFNNPDNESWTGSYWTYWTDPSVSGRPWWAERTSPQSGSGRRGAAAFGWLAGNEMGIYQDSAAAANVVYTFAVWIKREINYNEDTTQLKMEWLDKGQNWIGGNITSNLTGQANALYNRFRVTGSTSDTNCAVVRMVIWTKWRTPTNTTSCTLQVDDAELIATPPTVIRIK